MKPYDAHAATQLEQLASEGVRVIVRRDQRWLRRRVDPAAILAVLFLLAPGVAGIVAARDWDSGWRWPVISFCIVWILFWVVVGGGQLSTESTDDAAARDPKAEWGS